MTTTYSPKPGSVADRAIAHLQSQPPAGAEVSSAALAEAVGVASTSIHVCMASALDAGAVFARKKGGHVRSPLFWSLVDHAAKNARTGEASSPTNGSQTPDGGQHGSSTAPARAGRETPRQGANRDASAEPSHGGRGSESPTARGNAVAPALGAAPAPLRIALWSDDGTLQIERDGDDLVVLTQRETRELVRYLDRLSEREEAA